MAAFVVARCNGSEVFENESRRRLLRETATSVVAMANEVGCSNTGHFDQLSAVYREQTVSLAPCSNANG
jgi:hypothetical protein